MIQSITIITDCHDENAQGRQIARYASLFPGTNIHIMGTNYDIQAGGFLMDTLDSLLSDNHLIIVNIAPRNGKAKKWKNGTPFGYFKYRNNTIIASVDGHTLSFMKKLGILSEFHIFDIPTTMGEAEKYGLISENDAKYVIHTQFRSFEFLPRIAFWLINNSFPIPTELYPIEEIPDVGMQIWNIDNFGNCKTTIFSDEIRKIELHDQNIIGIPHKEFLHSLESGSVGLVNGSSGYRNRRCIEIIRNGGNIAKEWGLEIGHSL